jgi:hypothetical protein
VKRDVCVVEQPSGRVLQFVEVHCDVVSWVGGLEGGSVGSPRNCSAAAERGGELHARRDAKPRR